MIALSLFLFISVSINVVAGFILQRFASRILQFDTMFDAIQEDLNESVDFFEEILSKPVLMNSPEIKAMNEHIALTVRRFKDYSETFKEVNLD